MSNSSTAPAFSNTMRFAGYNFLRLRRNLAPLFFTTILPVFFYLLFGTLMDVGSLPIHTGKFAALQMISMALYGGVAGAVGAAASSVTDARSGWRRQLALTPLRPHQIFWANITSIALQALLPIAAVFLTGALTKADMEAHQWALSFLACAIVSIPFGLYGMIWALALPTDNSVAIASSSIVLLLFAANVFIPLSSSLMAFGRFTPLFGPVVLAQWPLAEGMQLLNDADGTVNHSLWSAGLNFAVWTAIFVGACAALLHRDKSRM